jgi:hypothetical protein
MLNAANNPFMLCRGVNLKHCRVPNFEILFFLQQLSLVELNTGMDVLIIGGKGGYINSLVAISLTF